MQEKNSGYGNDNNMPIEAGIENQTNEMIYHSVDSERELDDRSKESFHDKDLRKEYSSTGAYEEYTAAKEEGLKSKDKSKTDEMQSFTNMNVEGMPWFYEEPNEQELQQRHAVPELSGRETRRVIMSSLLAALAVGGVFIGAMFLFLLFATKVWFS